MGNCKLTDFGLAKLMRTPADKATTFCGTPEYLAPEMVLHRKQMSGYGFKVKDTG
jgi:serine/threonine protein kinase